MVRSCTALCLALACACNAPAAPSASDQAQVTAYAVGLEACKARAKALDAGPDAEWTAFSACEGAVGRSFGFDGGSP